MTRPESYDDSLPLNRCGTCRFSNLLAEKQDLLCFHGDAIEVTSHSEYPVRADYVQLNGVEVNSLDGDEYGRFWAQRVVNDGDTCDEWERKAGES